LESEPRQTQQRRRDPMPNQAWPSQKAHTKSPVPNKSPQVSSMSPPRNTSCG
jgi:hypothetical protein